MKILLASSSPRRIEILKKFDSNIQIMKPQVIETIDLRFSDRVNAMKISFQKGQSIAKLVDNLDKYIILSADTVVSCESEILGKPSNSEDVFKTIKKLSGKTHKVITGFTIIGAEKTYVDYAETSVTFKKIMDEDIRQYARTEEPLDKAGAYGIQGQGSVFVDKIDGDYYNVVGLPISKIYDVLKKTFSVNLLL